MHIENDENMDQCVQLLWYRIPIRLTIHFNIQRQSHIQGTQTRIFLAKNTLVYKTQKKDREKEEDRKKSGKLWNKREDKDNNWAKIHMVVFKETQHYVIHIVGLNDLFRNYIFRMSTIYMCCIWQYYWPFRFTFKSNLHPHFIYTIFVISDALSHVIYFLTINLLFNNQNTLEAKQIQPSYSLVLRMNTI